MLAISKFGGVHTSYKIDVGGAQVDFYVNIDGGGGRKTGTIHTKECTWTNPVVKAAPTEFWFGTLTMGAARRIVAGLGAEENIHTLCIDRETLLPRVRS